jgi:hypothetical protein
LVFFQEILKIQTLFTKLILKTIIIIKINQKNQKNTFFLTFSYILYNALAFQAYLGMSPSGKAADFDSAIRRFESYHPSHTNFRFLEKGINNT